MPVKAVVVNDPSAKNAKETNENLAQSTTEVIGVQLQETEEGLTLFLETSTGREPQTFRTTYGETLVIDLTNSRLRLPEGETFQQQNPASGIASVEVVQQYANTVRVKLVGETEVPTAEVSVTEQGIALGINSEAIAQEPAEEATPAPATPSTEQPQAQEPIELVVTATRTEERETDVPRSVTVIDREEIEQQANITRDLSEILGKTVPGFSPPNQSSNINDQTLRGRNFDVQIDGVPQFTNRRTFGELQTIDPSAIERIEVVRGPTAIFGGNAAGGVINIITRSPTDLPFTATSKVGTTSSLTNFDDSVGFLLQQRFSGDLGDVDYTITALREKRGSFFDAEGDRIPAALFGGLDDRNSNATTYNFLGKIGWDITDQQRLQFSANYFEQKADPDFVADPDTPSDEKARALEIEGGLDFENNPGQENTVLNLNYSHENLLNSQVDAQLYYRDIQSFVGVSKLPGTDIQIRDTQPFQTLADFERWGARFNAQTPLTNQDELNLVWGADFDKQVDITQDLVIVEDTRSGSGFKLESIGTSNNTPPHDVASFGAFAQLNWEVTDTWNVTGGLRFESVNVTHDSYRPRDRSAFNAGEPDPRRERVPASEKTFSDTVFNIGTTIDINDNLNAFASFSQGFNVPDFGRILRDPPDTDPSTDELEFAGIGEDVELTQPQIVDQYELGLRGNWDTVQASIAGFFTWSELGIRLQRREDDRLEQVREPKRTWGLETQIDWQPTDNWQLGSSVTWVEGESEVENDGNFQRLDSSEIPPVKVTAYLENQTTPDWRNRLQLLWVGDREVDNEIASEEIDGYIVFDLISSFDLGQGQLQIAVENLFNNQFLNYSAQSSSTSAFGSRVASPGTTLTINYSFDW
jgi:iron complex outermembrane receptor protein